MATLPTPTATELAKRVRFSPFVTYMGDEPEHLPEMEGSLRLDSSYHTTLTTTGRPGVCANRTIAGGGGRINKRGSMDLTELFAVDRSSSFGNHTNNNMMTMGNGSSEEDGGFNNFGSCDLDVSGESILEEDEFDDDDDPDYNMIKVVRHQFGDLDLSLTTSPTLESSSFVRTTPNVETEPSRVQRRSSDKGKLIMETAV